jgi:hypothetical protein
MSDLLTTNATGLGVLGANLNHHAAIAPNQELLFRTRFVEPQVRMAASFITTAPNIDLEVFYDANHNGILEAGESLGRLNDPNSSSEFMERNGRLGTGAYYYRITNQSAEAGRFNLGLESDSSEFYYYDNAGNYVEATRQLGLLTPTSPIALQEGFSSSTSRVPVPIGPTRWDWFDSFRFSATTSQLVTLEITGPDVLKLSAELSGAQVQTQNGRTYVTKQLEPGMHNIYIKVVDHAGPRVGTYGLRLTAEPAALPAPANLDLVRSIDGIPGSTQMLSNTVVTDMVMEGLLGSGFTAYKSDGPSRGFIEGFPAAQFELIEGPDADLDLTVPYSGGGPQLIYASANTLDGAVIAKFSYGQNEQLWRTAIAPDAANSSVRDIRVRDIAIVPGVLAMGDTYVTGDSSSGAWVSRYNSEGQQLWFSLIESWVDTAPGGKDFGRYVAVDDQGNVVISGDVTRNGADAGNFVVKYSSNGQQRLWSTQVGSSDDPGGPQRSGGLVLDGHEGDIYGANAYGTIQRFQAQSGALVWSRNTLPNSQIGALAYRMGHIYATGSAIPPGLSLPVAFITQFTTAGQEAPVRHYLPRTTRGTAIAIDRYDGIYVGGSGEDQTLPDFTPGSNAFIARLRGY